MISSFHKGTRNSWLKNPMRHENSRETEIILSDDLCLRFPRKRIAPFQFVLTTHNAPAKDSASSNPVRGKLDSWREQETDREGPAGSLGRLRTRHLVCVI